MLNCTVVGDPLPFISWSVSGVSISLLLSNDIMILFNQQGEINDNLITSTTLDNIIIHSSLELMETASFIAGSYTCRASNILGNISSTATLIVQGMYPIIFMLCSFSLLCTVT